MSKVVLQQVRFALTRVSIRQDLMVKRTELSDVIMTFDTDAPVGFPCRMIRHLSVNLVSDGVGLARDQRYHRASFNRGRRLDVSDIAERRIHVDVTDYRINNTIATRHAAYAHHQHDIHAVVCEIALHEWERDTVIGDAYDERVVPQTILLEGVKDYSYPPIERGRRGL